MKLNVRNIPSENFVIHVVNYMYIYLYDNYGSISESTIVYGETGLACRNSDG